MNTPNVTQIYGLRGANLAAFHRAGAIVDAGMNERSESLLRQVRALLTYANDVYKIDLETADAFVARAANKLALVVGAQGR